MCPICGVGVPRTTFASPRLSIARCPVCRHRSSEQATDAAVTATDYHQQYDEAFVAALARTRRRQSRRIVDLIRRASPDLDGVVDFGAGRGWFLEGAQAAGVRRLAGVDVSSHAITLLRERGIEGTLVDDRLSALPRVSFQPDALAMLDVIEHFPVAEVGARLARVVAHYRPRVVVLKVPTSAGLLYRAAAALAAFGTVGPLEQLYQVGSHPPHWSYFSRRSLLTLLTRCGLSPLAIASDRDFEPDELARRVQALRRSGPFARPLGIVASALADVTGAHDALIVVARPNGATGATTPR
ncbi:MAG TPA: class I SAM-dependent methyltransferase [Polyangia bacterium]|nr:class I SAM-dependent methyltransferase [Polyangia bacterium]